MPFALCGKVDDKKNGGTTWSEERCKQSGRKRARKRATQTYLWFTFVMNLQGFLNDDDPSKRLILNHRNPIKDLKLSISRSILRSLLLHTLIPTRIAPLSQWQILALRMGSLDHEIYFSMITAQLSSTFEIWRSFTSLPIPKPLQAMHSGFSITRRWMSRLSRKSIGQVVSVKRGPRWKHEEILHKCKFLLDFQLLVRGEPREIHLISIVESEGISQEQSEVLERRK